MAWRSPKIEGCDYEYEQAHSKYGNQGRDCTLLKLKDAANS